MRLRQLCLAATAALASFLSAQSTATPCFEPDFGTRLGAGDEAVFSAVPLGFTFNYAGTAWTDISVCTNGFVWLGPNFTVNTRCCRPSGSQFVADPPSIAILWADLWDIAPTAGVYFHALPGRAVVTWRDYSDFGDTVPFTLQMQITVGGEVTFWYSPTTAISNLHESLAGITPGNGAADPGSTDLSASLPLITGAQPTFYEHWLPSQFDLAQRTLSMQPSGNGGWVVTDRPNCPFQPSSWTTIGRGCPQRVGNPNAEFYELFTRGTFDLSNTAIDLTPNGPGYIVAPSSATWFSGFAQGNFLADDQVLPVNLGFTLPTPAGAVNTVGMCTNGFLQLDSSLDAPGFANGASFAADGPRIYGLWTDLHRPILGSQTYADPIGSTKYAFTWQNMAELGSNTPVATFQIQVDASGVISLLWQAVNIPILPSLVGFSRGNGVPDPGSTDLSAAIPFQTGIGLQPLRLDAAAPPVLGGPFAMTLTQQPYGATAAFLALGFQQTSISLAGLGMPGCTQFVTLDASRFFPVSLGATTMTINLPNAAYLAGYTVFAQGIELAPNINALGVAASNGGRLTFGFF